MFKTQLVSTKGDVMRTFISSSRPQTRFGSEGVDVNQLKNRLANDLAKRKLNQNKK